MTDIWDILAVIGVLFMTAGIAFVYWPLALFFFGASLLALYILREFSHVPISRDTSSADDSSTESRKH